MTSPSNPDNEVKQVFFEDFVRRKSEELVYESGADRRLSLLEVSDDDESLNDLFDFENPREEINVDLLFPEGLIPHSDLIRSFLKDYYKFLQSNAELSSSGSFVINSSILETCRNIDKETDEGLQKIFHELAVQFSNKQLLLNNKIFLKNVVDFFSHKGNADSFKILIVLLFKDFTTNVYEPWHNVLHTSLGNWRQEKFFRVRLTQSSGSSLSIDDVNMASILLDEYGTDISSIGFNIDVSRIERFNDSQDEIRVYTFSNAIDVIKRGQTFVLKNVEEDEQTETAISECVIVPSFSEIRVIDGGKYWQKGHIIVLEASGKNTIACVESVSNQSNVNGSESVSAIRAVSIVDPGFEHQDGQTYRVTSFKYAPVSSDFSYYSAPQLSFPFGNDHYLEINSTAGTGDRVTGILPGDYFLTDYDQTNYDGQESFVITTTPETPTPLPFAFIDIGVTIEEWKKSFAILQVVFSDYGLLPGHYDSERSLLSNGFTRLQDNFFYQLFSYVVKNKTNPNLYKEIASLLHPAGTKRFFHYFIESFREVSPSFDLSSFKYFLDFLDYTIASAVISDKHVVKPREDAVRAVDFDPKCYEEGGYDAEDWDVCGNETDDDKDVVKPRFSATSTSDVSWKHCEKNREDQEDATDTDPTKDVVKGPSDYVFARDFMGDVCWAREDYDSEHYDVDCINTDPSTIKEDNNDFVKNISEPSLPVIDYETAIFTKDKSLFFDLIPSDDSDTDHVIIKNPSVSVSYDDSDSLDSVKTKIETVSLDDPTFDILVDRTRTHTSSTGSLDDSTFDILVDRTRTHTSSTGSLDDSDTIGITKTETSSNVTASDSTFDILVDRTRTYTSSIGSLDDSDTTSIEKGIIEDSVSLRIPNVNVFTDAPPYDLEEWALNNEYNSMAEDITIYIG